MAGVSFEAVTKRYGDVEAVRELSLEIADREFVVLVGPSGSGKTTALRMLAGLEAISEGVVRIGEREVNRVSPRDRDIAMVFQDYALYPQMTRARQPRLRAAPAQDAQGGHRVARGPRGRGARARRPARPPPARALRRPAAARGARPRAGARPAGLPDGRAALQPRREAARADPRRDQAPPEGGRDDHGLRHPRPGRGDDDGRPDRGHERRAPGAGRHARGASTSGPPTASWRASSAARR